MAAAGDKVPEELTSADLRRHSSVPVLVETDLA